MATNKGFGEGRRKSVLPEAIGKRPHTANDYEHNDEALSYDTTSVVFSTRADGKHRVIAPRGQGDIARRLRRYALVLSRYGLPDSKRVAKRWDLRHSSVVAAERLIANAVHIRSFADDPTLGTVSVDGIANLINEGKAVSPELVAKALSLANTQAYADLLSKITNPEVQTAFASFGDVLVSDMVTDSPTTVRSWNSVTRFESVNSKNSYHRRNGLRWYRNVAQEIEQRAEQLSRKANTNAKPEPKTSKPGDGEQRDRTQYPGRGIPQEGLEGNWYPLFVAKPPLDIAHRGRMGRRKVRSAEGKFPTHIERLVTDPERRIFSRKTRSLGAVVVVDCSGSMAWDDDDLASVVDLTAGATVLCYSTGNDASEAEPNAWIVARNNLRVRHLPEFPGGNGCDGPALLYAAQVLRQRSSNPIVWVSDQRVTGRGDSLSSVLRAETDALVRRYGIRVVETSRQAQRLLADLQGRTR